MPSSVKDFAKMAPNADAGEAISKLESETFTLNVRDNVKFALNMNMTEASAATKLKELIDQVKDNVLGPAALTNEQLGSELADLVGSIQVGAHDKAVTLQIEAKADFIDKAVKLVKDRGR
jgi:acetaldehyde dehydrogenase (acetylating)